MHILEVQMLEYSVIFYVCIHSVRGLWGMQSQLCQPKKSDIFFFGMKEQQNV